MVNENKRRGIFRLATWPATLLIVGFLLFQPKLALAQSAWTSGLLTNAVRALRAHQSASQTGVKSQKHGGGKESFEAQASGQGTNGRIAKWVDGIGTLGDSVITESSSGNIGIGTASPLAKLDIRGDSTFTFPTPGQHCWRSSPATRARQGEVK